MTGEPDPRADLQRASQARREGRLGEARSIAETVVARFPGHAGVLNLAGLIAQDEGRVVDAIDFLGRATEADSDAPPLWLNLAAALRISGDWLGEIGALDRALALDPALLPALLLKAGALERLGRIDESARAYRSLLAAAGDGTALPDQVRAALAKGREIVRRDDEARAARHGSAVEAVFADNEGADMRRARVYADAVFGRRRIYTSQPTGPAFPYLPAYEFYDSERFPWLAELECETNAIRGELVNIWEGGERRFDPYVQVAAGKPANQWAELDRSPRWGAFFFWKDGVRQDGACAECPATAALLDRLPMLDIPGLAPTAMFSILDAGTRIPPHTGVTNVRLTVHLPLIVPEGCGFRVGGDVRDWREGRAWAFDDTIEHEAWNDSARPRAILIIDAWNPLLSEAERAVVRATARAMRL